MWNDCLKSTIQDNEVNDLLSFHYCRAVVSNKAGFEPANINFSSHTRPSWSLLLFPENEAGFEPATVISSVKRFPRVNTASRYRSQAFEGQKISPPLHNFFVVNSMTIIASYCFLLMYRRIWDSIQTHDSDFD